MTAIPVNDAMEALLALAAHEPPDDDVYPPLPSSMDRVGRPSCFFFSTPRIFAAAKLNAA